MFFAILEKLFVRSCEVDEWQGVVLDFTRFFLVGHHRYPYFLYFGTRTMWIVDKNMSVWHARHHSCHARHHSWHSRHHSCHSRHHRHGVCRTLAVAMTPWRNKCLESAVHEPVLLPSTVSTRLDNHTLILPPRPFHTFQFCSVSDEDPPAGQYTVPRLLMEPNKSRSWKTRYLIQKRKIVFCMSKGWSQEFKNTTNQIDCWNRTFFSWHFWRTDLVGILVTLNHW